MQKTLTIRGKSFIEKDIFIIKKAITQFYDKGRSEISRQICIKLNWRQPNGWLKDRACRDVLIWLQKEGIVKLPPPKVVQRTKAIPRKENLSERWLSKMPMISHYFKPKLQMVKGTSYEKMWNELVRQFHYQGYSVIVGNNIKYLAFLNDIPIACLGWGSAAWSVEVRDKWLRENYGWKRNDIIENLPKIINNVRFLILPWVRVKNLASTLLSLSEHIIKKDWDAYYNVDPILLETFVEKSRFKGTCYKAANWIYLGATKGNGKKGNSWITHNNIKDMFIRPLNIN